MKTLFINGSEVIENHQLTNGSTELEDDQLFWIDWNGPTDQKLTQYLAKLGLTDTYKFLEKTEKVPAKYVSENDIHWLLIKGLSAESADIDFDTVRIGFFWSKNILLTIHDTQSVSTEAYWHAVQSQQIQTPQSIKEIVLSISRRVMDRYLLVLSDVESEIDEFSTNYSVSATDDMLNDLTLFRLKLKRLRRYSVYHSEAFTEFRSDDSIVFDSRLETRMNMITELLERKKTLCQLFYEDCKDLIDGYISLSAHRLNHIMKVLTMVTVLFVPLSFLAGVYGMNFNSMPELSWRYGYFAVLSLMFILVVSLIIWFKKKRWL
ncbi:magnesium transporter CorA family protein [Marinicella sp. W31]|uniref:magnesium transporter CorA family protein n=1 Tax=Marinicella sp. W31 TaxID=3023713 RepID=UPI0037564883